MNRSRQSVGYAVIAAAIAVGWLAAAMTRGLAYAGAAARNHYRNRKGH